jgi:hypothetical protein
VPAGNLCIFFALLILSSIPSVCNPLSSLSSWIAAEAAAAESLQLGKRYV